MDGSALTMTMMKMEMKIMTTSNDTKVMIVIIIIKIIPACGLLRPDCLWPAHRLGSRRTWLWQGTPCYLLFVYLYLLIVFCNLFIPFLWPGHPVRQDRGQVRLHPPFLRRSSQGGGRLWLWARWAEFFTFLPFWEHWALIFLVFSPFHPLLLDGWSLNF